MSGQSGGIYPPPAEESRPPRAPVHGLPLGLPVALPTDRPSPQVIGTLADLRGTTPLPSATTVHLSARTPPTASRRVGHRRLLRLTATLSDRDKAVLQLIQRHRFLSGTQLEAFCFNDHASASSGARTGRRVLTRLARDGLLRSLERRIGGVRGGSAGRIWQLAPAGARLLQGDGERSHRVYEPSAYFLAHTLAVSDVHLQLRTFARRGDVTELTVQVEAEAARSFLGGGGETRRLRPDLYVAVDTDRYVDRYFVEVDLGTESLPTLLQKCHLYETYRGSGKEQTDTGSFPLVVWVMHRARRVEQLLRAIARGRGLTPELYRVLLPDELPAFLEAGS